MFLSICYKKPRRNFQRIKLFTFCVEFKYDLGYNKDVT